MIINNNYQSGQLNIGQVLYDQIMSSICKDMGECKHKHDVLTSYDSRLSILIDEEQNGEFPSGPLTRNTLHLERSDIFRIDNHSDIFFNVQEYWDTKTETYNVKFHLFLINSLFFRMK
jgi:hypothetical protein